MKSALLKTFGLIAVTMLVTSAAIKLVASHGEKRTMPAGFHLECDGNGNYRACRDSGMPLISLGDSSTKADALRTAWRQYEYERKLRTQTWRRCEETGN